MTGLLFSIPKFFFFFFSLSFSFSVCVLGRSGSRMSHVGNFTRLTRVTSIEKKHIRVSTSCRRLLEDCWGGKSKLSKVIN